MLSGLPDRAPIPDAACHERVARSAAGLLLSALSVLDYTPLLKENALHDLLPVRATAEEELEVHISCGSSCAGSWYCLEPISLPLGIGR